MSKVRKRCSAGILMAVGLVFAGCSDGVAPDADAGTILFTNGLGFDYVAVAYDRTAVDTMLVVPSGAQVCWRLSGPRPMPLTLQLYSYGGPSAIIFSGAEVHPRLQSWMWDGAAPTATEASSC